VPPTESGRDASGGPAAEAITRIVLRPVASSLPLGFLAFGAPAASR
jgi:hypothetical protein